MDDNDYNGHKIATFILNAHKTTTIYSLEYDDECSWEAVVSVSVFNFQNMKVRLFDKIFHLVFTVLQYPTLTTFFLGFCNSILMQKHSLL